MKIYRYFLVFSLFFLTSETFAKNCQEVRMGLDIGSGSTKMLVAKVDFCQHKILEVLLSESKPVPFNEELEKSKDNNLNPAIVERGLQTISEMTKKGKTFKPKKIYGVATSVFRKSSNGVEVIKSYARKLKLKLEVITQDEEAMLGYLSAKALSGETDFVAWDIGGGSMQMWSQVENKKPETYLGELASVTFKNMVIEVIQSKNIETINSPNPIGDKREQVLALARAYARLHVPAAMKMAIKERVMIGVGGVHSQSIKNQLDLKNMNYTVSDLDRVSKLQAMKSDNELTGDYRSTDVTNLLLVQGFMEGLGIKAVTMVNATLLQGAVLR